MPTIAIDASTSNFIADQANTTYTVAQGIDKLTSGTAINGNIDVANRVFEIQGHVTGGTNALVVGSGNSTANKVHVGEYGVLESDAGAALYVSADDSRIDNEGVIFGATGVNFRGDNAFFANSGTVIGTDMGIGVGMEGVGAHLVNTGTIVGLAAVSTSSTIGHTFRLDNSGTIFGSVWALEGSSNREVIVNSGQMTGIIEMYGGADTYINKRAGMVTGEIRGGAGDDLYVVNRADLALVEASGEGFDTVKASVDFTLGNSFEYLVLTGRKAIDGTGNSINNHLTGNAVNNVLKGMGGLDELAGGRGTDRLYGGDQSDTFIFKANAGKEIIMDFTDGVDRVRFMPGKDVTSSIDLLADHAREVNGDVVLEANGTTFVIKNIDLDHFTISDFIF